MAATLAKVRTALAALLTTQTGLTVKTYEPLLLDPQDAPLAIVYIRQVVESRRGFGGADGAGTLGGGTKKQDYFCNVLVKSLSMDLDGLDAAQATFEAMLEAISLLLRKNQKLVYNGTEDLAIRFGEDITTVQDAPTQTPQGVLMQARISSTLWAQIQG